jgi:hypothetical protein
MASAASVDAPESVSVLTNPFDEIAARVRQHERDSDGNRMEMPMYATIR